MFTRLLAAAGLTVALLQVPANAAAITPAGKEKAAEACQAINQYGPATVTETVEDGLGDWIVWVKDKDGDLWMCNANSNGAVFTNAFMQGDLLKGEGGTLLGLQTVADSSSAGSDPAKAAESLCAAVGGHIEDVQVVATVGDGLGDFVTWLKNANDELWICNASGDSKLYGFEPVDQPLNGVKPVELRNA